MLSREALSQLIPITFGGSAPADLAIEGAFLDTIRARLAEVFLNAYPERAVEALSDWERVYEIVPDPGSLPPARQAALAFAALETQGISSSELIALATRLGYTITIGNTLPFRADISVAGDRVYGTSIFTWSITITVTAGDCDLDLTDRLENLLREKTPARAELIFVYDL
jgi:uncharacterized protein YmfQ (DUF2313 family)